MSCWDFVGEPLMDCIGMHFVGTSLERKGRFLRYDTLQIR